MRRLLIALFLFASPAWAQNFRGTVAVRTHATDCTALTDGTAGQVCVELDSDRFFTCQPTAGGCDTGAEWILTPAAGGGGYATVDEDDTPLTQRTTLNFAGAGITCADDTSQTTCTVPAGSFSSPGAGIIVDTVGDGTLAARTLTAGDGISIANGAGAAGNPTVSTDSATVPRYVTGTATPGGTCQAGRDFYIETDANKLWSCTSTDTWTDTTLGGTPTLAQVTAAGATTATLMTLDNGATSAGMIAFKEDSSNGTNAVTLSGAQSTADVTVTLPAVTGTLPIIIASGAVTWDNASISSAACSSAQDGGTATGVATTDRIIWNPNGDPTAITGYVPLTAGGLYIWAYPTADHVNFKACNNTAGAIDPGSIVLNWMVIR